MKSLALLLVVAVMVGCAGKPGESKVGGPAKAANDKPSNPAKSLPPVVKNDGPAMLPLGKDKQMAALLKQCGLAYRLYEDALAIGPSKADDLADFVEKDERILKPLRSGEVVLIYRVKLAAVTSPSKTVLGYLKDTPTKGGYVLMADGSVAQMTAEEFKKAPLATPSK
jgi:hypothetical protein